MIVHDRTYHIYKFLSHAIHLIQEQDHPLIVLSISLPAASRTPCEYIFPGFMPPYAKRSDIVLQKVYLVIIKIHHTASHEMKDRLIAVIGPDYIKGAADVFYKGIELNPPGFINIDRYTKSISISFDLLTICRQITTDYRKIAIEQLRILPDHAAYEDKSLSNLFRRTVTLSYNYTI